jgi:hypothetical protein
MSFVVGTEGLRQFDVRFAVCAGSIAARICFLVFPSGMVEALRLEVKKRIAKPARSTYCGLLRPYRHARQANEIPPALNARVRGTGDSKAPGEGRDAAEARVTDMVRRSEVSAERRKS